MTKANQAIQTLEKYKAVLKQSLTNLSASEFEELVTIPEVVNVIQRTEMVLRIKTEIERYIDELGNEGRLISMQMEELVGTTEEEAWLLYKDYARDDSDDKIREIIVGLKDCRTMSCLMHIILYGSLVTLHLRQHPKIQLPRADIGY